MNDVDTPFNITLPQAALYTTAEVKWHGWLHNDNEPFMNSGSLHNHQDPS